MFIIKIIDSFLECNHESDIIVSNATTNAFAGFVFSKEEGKKLNFNIGVDNLICKNVKLITILFSFLFLNNVDLC